MRLCLIFIFCTCLISQKKPDFGKDYFVKFPLNVKNKSRSIHSIVTDKDGFVFIGTKNGILRFNGLEWKTYSLPKDIPSKYININGLRVDSVNGLWVGSNENILYSHNGIWRQFKDRIDVTGDDIRAIIIQNGKVVLGTKLGWIHKYDGESFFSEQPFKNKEITSLDIDENGTFFVGTNNGLYKQVKTRLNQEGVPFVLKNSYITSIIRHNDYIAVSTETKGLSVYSEGKWNHYNSIQGINSLQYSTLEKRLWLGTKNGLYYLKNGLIYTTDLKMYINTLYLSPDGRLWVGGFNGLYTYDPKSFRKIAPSSSFPKRITAIERLDRSIWFGSFDEGLALVSDEGEAITLNTSNSKLPSNKVSALLKDENSLWVGTSNGLVKIENGQISSIYLKGIFIDQIDIIQNNVYVISKSGKLFVLSSGKSKNVASPINTISSLVNDKNKRSFWIMSETEIAYSHNDEWHMLRLNSLLNKEFKSFHYYENSGLSFLIILNRSGDVLSIPLHEDTYLKIKKQLNVSFSTIYSSNSNLSQSKFDKKSNNLFLFSEIGLYQIKLFTENDQLKANQINIFGANDGLHQDEMTIGDVFIDSDKSFWLGTYDGLFKNKFSDAKIRLPNVFFHLTDKESKSLKNNSTFGHNKNNIKVQYEFPFIKRSKETVYRSKLVPIETFPTEWSAQNYRDLVNLPNGKYELHIWAKAYNGIVKHSEKTVVFEILKPWWYSFWAIVLYILIVLTIIYMMVKYRISAIEQKNIELEGLVEERTKELKEKNETLVKTNDRLNDKNLNLKYLNDRKSEILGIVAHDLKNPLTTILGFTELLLEDEKTDEKKSTPSYLEMINDSAKNMKDIIYQILNAERIEHGDIPFKRTIVDLEELINSVIRTYQLRTDHKKITIHKSIASDCHALVDEERMREVFDNLISNAIKYTKLKSNIWILMHKSKEKSDAHISLSIKDEGPGLTEDDKKHAFGRFQRLSAKPTGGESSTGLGLSIVKKFVEAHNGIITVESKAGEGATFKVKIPLF